MRASRWRAAWRCARAGCARSRRRRERSAASVSTRRAARPLRQRTKGVLDDAILERVERDDREARRRPAAGAGRVARNCVEPLELAIDPDPQRLKRPRRRIDPLIAAPRHRAAHDAARADRSSRSASVRRAVDDRPRDAAANSALRRTRRSRPRASPRRRSGADRSAAVGPCDWSIRMSSGSSRRKLKPRPSRVELHRRHAEIGERARRRRRRRARRARAAGRDNRRAPARRDRRTPPGVHRQPAARRDRDRGRARSRRPASSSARV